MLLWHTQWDSVMRRVRWRSCIPNVAAWKRPSSFSPPIPMPFCIHFEQLFLGLPLTLRFVLFHSVSSSSSSSSSALFRLFVDLSLSHTHCLTQVQHSSSRFASVLVPPLSHTASKFNKADFQDTACAVCGLSRVYHLVDGESQAIIGEAAAGEGAAVAVGGALDAREGGRLEAEGDGDGEGHHRMDHVAVPIEPACAAFVTVMFQLVFFFYI